MNLSMINDSLIKGLSSNLVVKIIITFYSFFTVPILFVALGASDYGEFLVIVQIFSFINLLELGLVNALSRSLARAKGQKNLKNYEGLISTTFWLIIGIVLFFSIIFFIFIIFFKPTLFGLFSIKNEINLILIISCFLTILLALPFRIGRGILMAKLHFFKIDLVIIFIRFISLILVLVLSYLNKLDLYSAIIIVLFLHITPEIICFIISIKFDFFYLLSIKLIKKKLALRQIDIGLASFLTSFSAVTSRQGFVILFALAAGKEFTHLIAIPVMIVLTLSPLVGKVSAIYLPVLSELIGAKDFFRANRQLHKGIFISSGISVTIIGCFWILGKNLIFFWLGNSMSVADIKIIYLISTFMITFSLSSRIFLVFRSYAQARGLHRNVTYISICSTIWTLISSFFVIYYIDTNSETTWIYFINILFIKTVIFDIFIMSLFSIYRCNINLDIYIILKICLIIIVGLILYTSLFFLFDFYSIIFIWKILLCLSTSLVYVLLCIKSYYYLQLNRF